MTHDGHLLVDLARLFDDHDEEHGDAPASAAPQHVAKPNQQPGNGVLGAAAHASSASPGVSDPFLLPGDEHTWDLDDWSWDPYHLAAVHKDQAGSSGHPAVAASSACCQALKKRKVGQPDLSQHALGGHVPMPVAAGFPGTGAGGSASAAGLQQATMQPAPPSFGTNSCCNFQMPAMHMPQQGGMPGTQRAASFPGVGAPAAGGWPSMLPPHALPNAMAWDAAAAAAAAMGAAPGVFPAASPAAMAPAVGDTASQSSSWSQMMPGSTPSGAPAVPGGPPPPIIRIHRMPSNQKPVPHPAALQSLRMSAPGLAGPAAACTPGPVSSSANSSEGDGTQQPGSSKAGAGDDALTASAPAAVKAAKAGPPALEPATYTGSLDDVVTLNELCAGDDAGRMQCQVAGCGRDLSGLKDYHQRYRICEVHIKLPQVLRGGRLQRFCQQCGRFHDLAAFDAGRKSCREQLSKHNARRRRRAQIENQKAKAVEQIAAGSSVIASALAAAVAAPSAVPAAAAAMALAAVGGASEPPGGEPPGDGGAGFPGSAGDVGRLLAALIQNPSQLHALRLLLGVQTHPALPPMQPFSPEQPTVPGSEGAAPKPADPPGFTLAREMLDGRGAWAPGFESDDRALRISMKLFNRTPADLPPDLRAQVGNWLASMPTGVSGAIRPGCVFLTLHLLLDNATHQDALSRGLASLLHHLRSETGCAFWSEGVYTVQMGSEVAMVAGGKVTEYHDEKTAYATGVGAARPQRPVAIEAATSAAPALPAAPCCGPNSGSAGPARSYPVLMCAEPRCAAVASVTDPTHPTPTPTGSLRVRLRVTGLDARRRAHEVVVRQADTQLRLSLQPDGSADTPGWYTVDLPVSGAGSKTCLGPGLVWLEVVHGAWLSPARPLLLLDDPTLAAEVQALTAPAPVVVKAEEGVAAPSPTPTSALRLDASTTDALLVDLGVVLAHVASATPLRAPFTCAAHGVVSRKARRLLLLACDLGWAALAARVLPLASAECGCAAEVVSAVHASSAVPRSAGVGHSLEGGALSGLSLLHRVVRSGNLSLLQGVLHWGAVAGYAWRADRNGPAGITPLHLAALHDDPRLLLALLEYAPPGAFTSLTATDGTTPFHLAFQMGHFTLDALLPLLSAQRLLPAAGSRAVLDAPAAPCKRRAAAGAIVKRQEGDGEDAGDAPPAPPERVSHQTGGEVDPCSRCHCTLPPMMLSIAACCADCGVRVPCLSAAADDAAGAGGVPGHDAAHCAGCTAAKGAHTHSATSAAATRLVGAKRPAPDSSSTALLAGLSRPAAPDLWPDARWCADVANNCVGSASHPDHAHACGSNNNGGCEHNDHDGEGASEGEEDHHLAPGGEPGALDRLLAAVVRSRRARGVRVKPSPSTRTLLPTGAVGAACAHRMGSVFTMTAICQGCHANRVLEVV